VAITVRAIRTFAITRLSGFLTTSASELNEFWRILRFLQKIWLRSNLQKQDTMNSSLRGRNLNDSYKLKCLNIFTSRSGTGRTQIGEVQRKHRNAAQDIQTLTWRLVFRLVMVQSKHTCKPFTLITEKCRIWKYNHQQKLQKHCSQDLFI